MSWGERDFGTGAGRLAENVVHFARVLRAAGLPVGTHRARMALEALQAAGLGSREEFRATLRCCLVGRAEHLLLFEQAFAAYWRDPDVLGALLRLRLPQVTPRVRPAAERASRRLAEALAAGTRERPVEPPPAALPEQHVAAPSWSERERLRKADFDTMDSAEWHAARRLVRDLACALPRQRSRRREPAPRGAVDLRRALRSMARHGGELAGLPRCRPQWRPAPIVMLVDISGSMSRYSRMLLHFAHQLAGGEAAAGRRVAVFVFGTRLSHVTRQLSRRDPDQALASAVRAVEDWAGGTRIAACLARFNRDWLRRVGGTRATVLLATDGLDHADFDALAAEAARLRRGCRRLVWLNPLLRYADFEPRARGVQALLPQVTGMVPMHNVESLEALGRVLGAGSPRSASPWT